MGKFIDRTGQKIGRLTVIGRSPDFISSSGKHRTMWHCICECGNEVDVRADSLNGTHTLSCGCIQKEYASKAMKRYASEQTKHGESRERLRNIWYLIKYRCEKKESKSYIRYGGRGIKMCTEWSDGDAGYFCFKDWALSNGYADDKSIDRIDNDGNYEPGNCRWVDAVTQNNNKRVNKFYEYRGSKYTLAQWSRICGIRYGSLWARIKSGWDIESALTRKTRGRTHSGNYT